MNYSKVPMKVELENVSFGYDKDNIVLDGISFTIESSESISIVGSSGCGKSTLLRIICGLLPDLPHQKLLGQIHLGGLNVISEKSKWKDERSKGILGFMFQEHSLLPNLTVGENIHLPLKIIGKSNGGEQLVSEYLKLTGLEKWKNELPSMLSGGMKTRTALARTFISQPKLLLLDEPFSSLDVVWKAKLYEEVRKLRNISATTTILVTHDIFEAIFFSDIIVVLGDNHKIIEKVSIRDWSNKYTFDDIILKYYKEFVYIKHLIEYNSTESII